MKICWDNLEKVKYNRKTGIFYDNYYDKIEEHLSCLNCGDPFLGYANQKYCDRTCMMKSIDYRQKLAGARKGKKFTAVHKRRISEALAGKSFTEERKQNISKSLKGRLLSEDHKRKISPLGRKHSVKTRGKISRAHKGKIISDITREKMRASSLERFKNPEDSPFWRGGYNTKNIATYDTYAHQLEPVEQCRRNNDDPNILEVKCTYCGKWHVPTRTNVSSRIKGLGGDTCKLYCSDNCKRECPIYGRQKYYKGREGYSSREIQPELRQLVFARDNWTCQRCKKMGGYLHCHHIDPVINNPVESADIDNCITLCKQCHKETHKLPGCRQGELQCK
jgi:5-methylcytosine-specific restriction endonuclease McrA